MSSIIQEGILALIMILTLLEKEIEALCWLVDVVQDAVNVPICLDSPSLETLTEVLPRVKNKGLINSASAEGDKSRYIYPLAAKYDWEVIALTIDDNGIPHDVEQSLSIARRLVKDANHHGVLTEKLYIDPLVIALSTDNQSMMKFLEVMDQLKKEFPEVKVISGLSNISFGMPKRRLVNRNFLAIAMYEGMDAAILDPLDKGIMGTVLAIHALMGADKYCHAFSKAYRSGLI